MNNWKGELFIMIYFKLINLNLNKQALIIKNDN